jgi:1,4-dihydroxy-2-naphthoate octaprenyltransferase
MTLKTLIQTSRPSFLMLPLVCVLLGVSLVDHDKLDLAKLSLIIAVAVLSHISVNLLNEYVDFQSGLDFNTQKTPFSGGSGALPNHPQAAKTILWVGIATILLAISLGLVLIFSSAPNLVLLGILGIVLVVAYTPWINRMPIVCLLAPGSGFGLLMVIGTYMALEGHYSHHAAMFALIPFFLTNNLLLLNQFPDAKADATVGRRTFPIVFGFKVSCWVYGGFAALSYALILLLIIQGALASLGLIALIPSVLSMYALKGAIIHTDRIGEQPRYLAANVMATLLTPLMLAMVMLFD